MKKLGNKFSKYFIDVQQKRNSVLGDQVSKHAVGFIADEFCGGLRDKWKKWFWGVYFHGIQHIRENRGVYR